jgi:hypothetical protein
MLLAYRHQTNMQDVWQSGAGECTTAVMLELRSRAEMCIRDCRGWRDTQQAYPRQ